IEKPPCRNKHERQDSEGDRTRSNPPPTGGNNSILPYTVSLGNGCTPIASAKWGPCAYLPLNSRFHKKSATHSVRTVALDVTTCRRDKGDGVSCGGEEVSCSLRARRGKTSAGSLLLFQSSSGGQ